MSLKVEITSNSYGKQCTKMQSLIFQLSISGLSQISEMQALKCHDYQSLLSVQELLSLGSL